MRRVYLDYNATSPVRPEVLEGMLPFFRGAFGNPSSIHWGGREVKKALETARERVALLAGCDPAEIVFTSSGTEGDNLALKGVASALRDRGNHIIASRVEHPAVLNSCLSLEREGFEITLLDVDADGMIDPAALERAVTSRTILISLMAANNETGTIFPVREIGEIAARNRVPFHCDAVQAAGRLPLDCRGDGIRLLSLSGHKIGAPKGVGALVVRTGVKLHPLLHGGAQERNRRGGTENVAGIVGFGIACELALAELTTEPARLRGLRDRLEREVLAQVPGGRINGHRELRLPNTSSLSFPGASADSLLMSLDLAGIAASSGAACSSGTLRSSHVLLAMGLEPEAVAGSLRFSLGRETTGDDVDYLVAVLPEIVERIRNANVNGEG